jgi:hypothetical protein
MPKNDIEYPQEPLNKVDIPFIKQSLLYKIAKYDIINNIDETINIIIFCCFIEIKNDEIININATIELAIETILSIYKL